MARDLDDILAGVGMGRTKDGHQDLVQRLMVVRVQDFAVVNGIAFGAGGVGRAPKETTKDGETLRTGDANDGNPPHPCRRRNRRDGVHQFEVWGAMTRTFWSPRPTVYVRIPFSFFKAFRTRRLSRRVNGSIRISRPVSRTRLAMAKALLIRN